MYWISISLLLVLLVMLGGFAWVLYKNPRSNVDLLFSQGKVLGASTVAIDTVEIDIGNKNEEDIISYELFAGAHNPKMEDEQVWRSLSDVGVTGIRKDFFLEHMLPKDITIDMYRDNIGNVQNIDNWELKHMQKTLAIYQRAQDSGMDVTAILSYSPKWLNVNPKKEHSLPKDWEVYEDIVGKSYKYYRPHIDKIEIWNEPDVDYFFDYSNSGLTRGEAYSRLFIHASRAIRAVDEEINDGKRIMIGGPVIADSRNNQPLKAVLANSEARENLDFVSYHDYEQHQNSWRPIIDILKSENLNIPVYVTEWSKTFDIKEYTPEIMTNRGITYTADKLISYANAGIRGANYFALQPIEPNSDWGNVGFLGFYMDDNKALLPLHKTWKLMSNTLGLGVGEAYRLPSTSVFEMQSVAFENSEGEIGYVVSNSSQDERGLSVKLRGVLPNKIYRVEVYGASASWDGVEPLDTIMVSNRAFDLLVPAETVVGLKFEEVNWFNYRLVSLIRQLQSNN